MNLYGIYGASGYGREVMPILKKNFSLDEKNNNCRFVFVDDNNSLVKVNEIDVLSFDKFIATEADNRCIAIAIANSVARQKLSEKCISMNIDIIDITCDNNIIMDNVEIGKGCILSPFVTITSNVKIGVFFQANIYSYVAHDCIVGDYVTFAPGVKCNGNVLIEDHVYIGTGAIIKQGKPNKPLKIGAGAMIGAGAVVTKNVPSGVTVFGNPASLLTKDSLRK